MRWVLLLIASLYHVQQSSSLLHHPSRVMRSPSPSPATTTKTATAHASVQQFAVDRIARVAAGLLTACVVTLGGNHVAVAADAEETFVGNVATMITAKRILEPVDKFVELSAYDNARTNIKYVLNQLQLQKNADSLVRLSLDFTEDPDLVDAATEAAGRITTTAQNVDSSVYTVIFIPPAEDGLIPPNAVKFRKQAIEYLNAFRKDLDTFIMVPDEKTLAKAKTASAKMVDGLPPVLFKVVKEAPTPEGYDRNK